MDESKAGRIDDIEDILDSTSVRMIGLYFTGRAFSYSTEDFGCGNIFISV